MLCSALGALLITAACGGGDPPGGENGNDGTDGGGMVDREENPTGDGPTDTCEWDETDVSWPFPDDPDDPMMDPDCNPLIPCINEDDDDHGWRDVRRDDGMPLRTDFQVHAAAYDLACAFYYDGEGSEIRHAPGDACVTIGNETGPAMVLTGDRLSLDATQSFRDSNDQLISIAIVAEGQVLDNGTQMRYTILEVNNEPLNRTFEIERLPLPPGVTTSERCLPPP